MPIDDDDVVVEAVRRPKLPLWRRILNWLFGK